MAGTPRPPKSKTADLLYGYAEIGEYVGLDDRQAEHIATSDKSFPVFNIGRRRCALRSEIDAWLIDKARAGRASNG